MKILLALAFVSVLIAPVGAVDLDRRVPAKAPAGGPPPRSASLADPAPRQGGDTIADAVPISIPTVDLAGTTVGYGADYDEMCPYGANAPDVVYSILPAMDMGLDIDLCGSSYDTKLLVYDENLALVGCNDDYYWGPPCGNYVSWIEDLPVTGGVEYFIVVTGYGNEAGDYLLDVVEHLPCELECPGAGVPEGEPPPTNDYVDLFNGGCDVDGPDPLLQPVTAPVFCGVSGYYRANGVSARDSDWLLFTLPASGVLEITGDAERPCSLAELWPQDCELAEVVQQVVIGRCAEATLTIVGDPGSPAWIRIEPITYVSPVGSYPYAFDYLLTATVDVIATERRSWSEVKALFD
jgi:hypothetical protein